MRYIKVIFGIIVVLFGIVFILENRVALEHAVQLKFDIYFLKRETPNIPLWVLILFTYFLGAFTAFLYFIYEHIKQRQAVRTLKHNVEVLGAELKRACVTPQPAESAASHSPAHAEGAE